MAASSSQESIPPWARDAAGRRIPTYYKLDGTTLIQVVEHRAAGTSYPVVADPKVSIGLFELTVTFSRSETAYIAGKAADGGAAAVGAAVGVASGFNVPAAA